MSIQTPRKYSYWERMKAVFNVVQDASTKILCDDILLFLQKCAKEGETMDFTDKSKEETIHNFLTNQRDFAVRFLDKFIEFSTRSNFDFLAKDGIQKNKNRLNAMQKTIEQHSYNVLCLCALYCPVEYQKSFAEKLYGYLQKIQPDHIFQTAQLTVWTSLLLLINPVKLKQQCEVENNRVKGDGSAEIFGHFQKILQRPQGPEAFDHRCLKGTISLALGVSIKYGRNSLGLGIPHDYDDIELVNNGIAEMALEFIHAYIVRSPTFSEFSLSVDVVDSLLKNFICYFRDKLVEMNNLCEEELYSLMDEMQEGNQMWSNTSIKKTPNFANLHFKTLLELISALYEPNTAQLKQYSREYTDPNSEGLSDFINRGRSISAPPLKIAYLTMLISLCKSAESADVYFNLFK